MKKFIISIAIVILALAALYYIMNYRAQQQYTQRAQGVIDQVEQYHQQHGKLPLSMDELSVQATDSGHDIGPYYARCDDERYTVIFFTGFDNNITYDSVSKKWQDDVFPTCLGDTPRAY